MSKTALQSFLFLSLAILCLFASGVRAAETKAPATLTLPQFRNATGDLDALIKRRRIRILVPYSKTEFFYDKERTLGLTAELGKQLGRVLNKAYGSRTSKIHAVFVPTSRAKLLSDLVAGRGDVAAGMLTATPEREAQVEFIRPWLTPVKEVVVTGPSAPPLSSLDDLAGKEILVRKSSSYFAHLTTLSDGFKARKLDPIAIKAAAEDLEDEDLLEMANAGILPYVVVDRYKALLWARVFNKLTVHEDLAVNEGGAIGWAIRKDSPKLRAKLDTFVAGHGLGTSFGNTLKRRYFTEDRMLKTAYAPQDQARFEQLVAIFKHYGDEYGFDYLMMGAQGFQESRLDQSRRSPRGAVGVMQLLPSTAASKEINIKGIDKDADANIHAGVLYMRHLADAYVNDTQLDARNRVLMTFAAYNAGPGNLRKFRKRASADGLDPNIWFGNVENAAGKIVGAETVVYVGNIYKYYIAYSLLAERKAATAAARTQTEKALGQAAAGKP